MTSAKDAHENRMNALEERLDAMESTIKATETRVKSTLAAVDRVAMEKGEIDGKIIKIWEAIGSIRGSVGAAARHGGGEGKPVQLQLPPGVELSPIEQQLFTSWNWSNKQIQEYANAKALYQTVKTHSDKVGSSPQEKNPESSQKKGRATS